MEELYVPRLTFGIHGPMICGTDWMYLYDFYYFLDTCYFEFYGELRVDGAVRFLPQMSQK